MARRHQFCRSAVYHCEAGQRADTVLKARRRAGVAIRPRRGGPRSG